MNDRISQNSKAADYNCMMDKNMPILLTDEAYKDLFDHLFDPEQNGDEYTRLNALEGDNIGYNVGFEAPANFELKLLPQPQEGIELEVVLLDHYRERVVYFNRVEVISDLPMDHERPVAQVMIWRERGSLGSIAHGLVQKVFFNLLVKEYDVVVSDSEQTREGRGMWQGLLSDAVNRPDLEAAILDKISGERSPLRSEKDLYNASNWLWGDKEIHRNRLGLIQKLNSVLMLLVLPAMFSFAGGVPV